MVDQKPLKPVSGDLANDGFIAVLDVKHRGSYRIQVTAEKSLRAAVASSLPASGPTVSIYRYDPVVSAVRLFVFAAFGVAATALVLRGLRPPGSDHASSRSEGERAVTSGSGEQKRMLFIDGLRGLACLAVVGCHFLVPEFTVYADELRKIFPDWVSSVLHHGDKGVELFFVLSGFVIAYSLREKQITPLSPGVSFPDGPCVWIRLISSRC